MAWNEPGGQDKDPWGQRGPEGPDLDEALRKLRERFRRLFGGGPGMSPSLVIGVLAILVGIWALAGFYQVNEQERAVVLRFGVYHETRDPGLHWHPPLVDQITRVNTTRVRSHAARALMLTRQVNTVNVEISVQYTINDPVNFVLKVSDPERSLREAMESATRHVVGNSPLDKVLTEGRAEVALEIEERLQTYIDSYETGILITKVNIEETAAPEPVQDAFKDVTKAREDEVRFKNQAEAYANGIIPEARGKARRMHEDALAYRDRVIARAEGEAERFRQLLVEYRKAPAVTRQRLYLDTMQDVLTSTSKVLVDVEGGSNLLYLPLDKLARTSTGAATEESATVSWQDDQRFRELVEQVKNRLQQDSGTSRGREGRR